MPELNQDTSGSTPATSGAGESTSSTATSGVGDESTKQYEKLLKEKQNYAKSTAELKAELEEFRNKEKQREEAELIKTQQHEKVIELRNKELEETKNELLNYRKRESEGRKSIAVLSELKKLGFVDTESNKEIVMKLLDKKDVEIDPTTNTVLGADLSAKVFFEKYNNLGLFGKTVPGVNQNSPQGFASPLTLEEWRKLPMEEQVKSKSEVEATLGIIKTK